MKTNQLVTRLHAYLGYHTWFCFKKILLVSVFGAMNCRQVHENETLLGENRDETSTKLKELWYQRKFLRQFFIRLKGCRISERLPKNERANSSWLKWEEFKFEPSDNT